MQKPGIQWTCARQRKGEVMRKMHLVDVSPDKHGSKGFAKPIKLANPEHAVKRALGIKNLQIRGNEIRLETIKGEDTPNGVRVYKATKYDKSGRILDSFVVAVAQIDPVTGLLLSSGRLVETA